MGTEPLTGSAGDGGCTKSGSRRCTQGILPSFGPQGCVKPYCCFVDCIVFLLGSAWCYSTHEPLARPSVAMGVLLLLRAHGASFYMLKGLPTGGSAGGGKNGECCSGYSCLHSSGTVLSNLALTAGDKGIKCPSASRRRCREVDRQERHC